MPMCDVPMKERPKATSFMPDADELSGTEDMHIIRVKIQFTLREYYPIILRMRKQSVAGLIIRPCERGYPHTKFQAIPRANFC